MTGTCREPTASVDPSARTAVSPSLHESFLRSRMQEFGDEHCFLCGCHIPKDSGQRTKEHVFPRWLLRDLGLWRDGVTRIDGSRIGYRKMTVPCCQECNGIDLGMIEGRVRAAHHGGIDAFAALDRRDLFLWLAKIAYSLAYLAGRHARVGPVRDDGRWSPAGPLRELDSLHLLLRAASGAVTWAPDAHGPASVYVVGCLDDDEPVRRFGHLDDPPVPMIGLRVGAIGVVGVLQDWGRSEAMGPPQPCGPSGAPLDAEQFRELYRRIAERAAEIGRPTTVEFVGGDVVEVRPVAAC